jgi:hypothetical protein
MPGGGGRQNDLGPQVNTWDKYITESRGGRWGDATTTQVLNPNYIDRDPTKHTFYDTSGNKISDLSGINATYAQKQDSRGHGGGGVWVDDPTQFQNYTKQNSDGTYSTWSADGKQIANHVHPSSGGGGFFGGVGDFFSGLGDAASGIVHGVGQAASDIASTPLGKAAILGGLAIATGGFSSAGAAAAAGEGAAASGAAGALGMNAGLAANAVNAGVMNAGVNLASGGNLDSALKAGVTGAALSGVGGWASGVAKDAVSDLNLGKDATNAIGSVASGAATGGTSAALQGKDIGQGILTGATNGIANSAGNYVGGQVKDLTGSDTLAGAASGGTSALLTGGNVGQGIIMGGIDAATGINGSGALANAVLNKPSTPPPATTFNTPVAATPAPAEPLPSGVIGNYLDWFKQGNDQAKKTGAST